MLDKTGIGIIGVPEVVENAKGGNHNVLMVVVVQGINVVISKQWLGG